MYQSRRTKILATLGPASSTPEMIKKLHLAGANLFRINMSHSSHAVLNNLVAAIRSVEEEMGAPIGILADLQGPKLRLGDFADKSIKVKPGDQIQFDLDETPGNQERVYLPHPEILSSLAVGDRILIDDGKVMLKTLKSSPDKALVEVVTGNKLSSRKGVSLPDTELGVSSLTPKDYKDLDAALEANVDWIAISFVQRPEDVAEVRKIVQGRAGVLSKIEKPQAIDRLDDIIELSDAIMVARGDLGVEMPIEQLPGLQKRMTRACRAAGKPVVVATQMLESMISSPFPLLPTKAMRNILVAPGVFNGTPAVIKTRSPGLA